MRSILVALSLALVACHGSPAYQADAAAADVRLTWHSVGVPECSGDVVICPLVEGRASYGVCLLPDGEVAYPRCYASTSTLVPCIVDDVVYEPVCAQYY